MTDHTYKVGDKGKTRGGDDYEVTAVGDKSMIVMISPQTFLYCRKADECHYWRNGCLKTLHGKHEDYELIPPKRRIQGWVNVNVLRSVNGGFYNTTHLYETKEDAIKCRINKRTATFHIDIEEGEGL